MRSKNLIKIIALGVAGLVLIIQIILPMKQQKTPTEFQDPEIVSQRFVIDGEQLKVFNSSELKLEDLQNGELAIKSITATGGMSISSSVAVTKFGEDALQIDTFVSGSTTSDVLFSADSMTKIVTAATILRMTEEEKYQEFLPDGIETRLSGILSVLKKYYPDSSYIQNELETQPNFEQITLQHLAQHASGLARVSREALDRKLYQASRKLTPEEMIDEEKLPKTGKYGENIGEYFYNDLGYELLGRIVVAVASEVEKSPQTFGRVANELVIDRVREKIGAEESAKLQFFTSDQMELVDGKTQVKGHPELKIEFGKHYHEQEFSPLPSHTYDLSCGGSYTNPQSMSIIAFHVLHSEPEFSVFEKPETLSIFNSGQVEIPRLTPEGKYKSSSGKVYGFGYESFSHPDYQRYRTHGGLGYGSNSNAFVDTKENKAAVTMVSFEDLTLPLAYALTNKEKPTASVRLDPKLYEKSLELSKSYSEAQMLEMRNGLEKSYEDFREKFDAIQKQKIDALDLQYPKKPSSSPEKSYAEKMVDKTRSGANEI